MDLKLTHKEANLVTAILWELAAERASVVGSFEPMWRLTDRGRDICQRVLDALEDANEAQNAKTGKDRDLSGAPKGTLQEARWQ